MTLRDVLRKLRASPKSQQPAKRRPRHLEFDQLESRLAPACSQGQVIGGQLTVNCDDTGNQVRIWNSGFGEFRSQSIGYSNGASWVTVGFFYLVDTSITSMYVNPGSGNDSVLVEGNARALTVEGNGGSQWDAVLVGDQGLLTNIVAAVTVRNAPASGPTMLLVDTSAYAGTYTATISESTLSFGGVPINYSASGLWKLALYGGHGNNTYRITNTPSNLRHDAETVIGSGTGADTINILGTTGRLVIRDSRGPDTVTVGNAGSLAGILGSIGVYTGNPNSASVALTVDTSAFTGTYSASLSNSEISFGNVPILYSAGSLRSLTLLGGSGNNTYTITSTPTSTVPGGLVTTIRAGAGDDLFSLGSTANRFDTLAGRLNLEAGGGNDAVVVRDQGTTTPTGYYFSAVGVTRTVTHSYSEVESVTFHGGSGGNTIAVGGLSGQPVNYALTLNTGAGSDSVEVGAVAGLGSIRGPLTINGQDGSDTAILDDSQFDSSPTYTIAATSVSRTGAALISYGTIENLNLRLARANTTTNVVGTAAGTVTTLNGSIWPVNDTFRVGSPGDTLDTIQGPLMINGGAGTDVVDLVDAGDTAGQVYYLTASTLDRFTAATISYLDLEGLTLQGGSGDDYFIPVGTAAEAPVTFVGRGGFNWVQGSNQDNTWSLAGAGYGSLRGPALGASVTFLGASALLGGPARDTFQFLEGVDFAGYVFGGDGRNALDYSGWVSDVIVNLVLAQATGTLLALDIHDATGGWGNDILVGNEQSNAFSGGAGRDVLIGGGINWNTWEYTFQPDALLGGDGEDILIGGFTYYDFDMVSLSAILAEWTSAAPYAQRVANLTSGAGVPQLDASVVFSNYAGNSLYGGEGLDLFFGRLDMDLNDHDPQDETFVWVY